jgi:hypothetical protein
MTTDPLASGKDCPQPASRRLLRLVLVAMAAAALGAEAVRAMEAPSSAPATPPEVRDLDASVLAHRRLVAQLHVRVTKVHAYHPVAYNEVVESWVDGALSREDVARGTDKDTRSFGNSFYSYAETASPDGGKYSLGVMALNDAEPRNKYIQYDPTMLGLAPKGYSTMRNYNKESFIGNPLRDAFQVTHESWRGKDAVRVSCVRIPQGSHFEYLVVPSAGYSAVEMRLWWSDGRGRKLTDFMEAVPERIDNEIWFPSAVHYERRVDAAIEGQEDLQIQVLSANEAIDHSSFEPVGMGIPPGTHVDIHPRDPRGELKWDGAQIVPMSPEELEQLIVPRSGARRGDRKARMALALASLVLAGIGGFVLWRRSPRGRRGSQGPVRS